jgi:gamma-glutamyltranspeptidase
MTKLRLQIISLSLLVSTPFSSLADIHKPEMAVTKKGLIVTCPPLAAQAGIEILGKGGNAADAFITTTLAKYVTAFGYTSLCS